MISTTVRAEGEPFAGPSTLANGTPVVVKMYGHPMPATLYLTSADATRNIQLSVDGGVTYFTPDPDANATVTAQMVVTIRAPVTHAKFTGIANDVYGVQ